MPAVAGPVTPLALPLAIVVSAALLAAFLAIPWPRRDAVPEGGASFPTCQVYPRQVRLRKRTGLVRQFS